MTNTGEMLPRQIFLLLYFFICTANVDIHYLLQTFFSVFLNFSAKRDAFTQSPQCTLL